jgi:hypothetical protein
MSDKQTYISIWFFIGCLLAFYGVLIFGYGIYELISPPPPEKAVAMSQWHASIWWGALLMAVGSFYTLHFRPGKDKGTPKAG